MIDKLANFIQRTKMWKKMLFFFVVNCTALYNTPTEMIPIALLINIILTRFLVAVFDGWSATVVLMNKIIGVVKIAEFADTVEQLGECKVILHQLKVDSFESEGVVVMGFCLPMFSSTEKLLNDLEEITKNNE